MLLFQCKDDNVSRLVRAVSNACERMSKENSPKKFDLEYFSTQNYVGLFLEEKAANYLRKLADLFAEEARNLAGKTEKHYLIFVK